MILDKICLLFDFLERVKEVTPDALADFQKLVDDLRRHTVGSASVPATAAELVAALQAGNAKVQASPRFLVNDLAKRISAAITEAVAEDETIATAILAKL